MKLADEDREKLILHYQSSAPEKQEAMFVGLLDDLEEVTEQGWVNAVWSWVRGFGVGMIVGAVLVVFSAWLVAGAV